MKPADFELLATTIKQRSGLVLTPEKAYLVESRLLPVVRKYNFRTLEELADAVRKKREDIMLRDITEAMTTNESYFFRDAKPFTTFQTKILPRLIEARAASKQLRFWSAGASSGQEAFSLAMVCAEEAAKLQGWKIEILGTDISREMIERCKMGLYTQFEVQRGLPIVQLVKYFSQHSGDKWQLKDSIRSMVQFREHNIIQDMTSLGNFDVVFCRNVISYFDQQTKGKVLNNISNIMQPDGYLLLGGNEAVTGFSERFKPSDEPNFFVVNNAPAAATMRA